MRLHSLRRPAVLATGALLAFTLGSAAAFAVGGDRPNGQPRTAPSRTTALGTGAGAPLAAPAAMPAGTDLQLHLVQPCRLLNTVATAKPLAAGATRNVATRGSLTGQGGASAGCGVPSAAVAVVANVRSLSRSGSAGFVVAWAAGKTKPSTASSSFTRYAPGTGSTIIPVSTSGVFSVAATATAHLVVDVTGYYTAPLYATVSSSGGIYQGASGVVSATRTAVGEYDVKFNRNIVNCSITTSDLIFSGNRDVSPDPTYLRAGAPDTVHVVVTNSADANEDTYFHITATC